MLHHYLTTALRNFVRNKFYTAITVVGLAFGITAVFLIVQYLKSELGYDRFHENAENIYRIAWINTNPQTRTPHPMAQAMVQDFPEVESAVSLSPLWGPGLTRQVFSVRNPEKDVRYDESNVLAVDSTFFQVFSFPLIKGDPKTVLKNPRGVLISESTAIKYFGTTDCIGRWLNDHKYGFQLQPITSIHLQSHLRWELEPNGNIAYVYLMSAAALLILIIGAVNFINLNMAQASERAKEIGLRKSMGAFRQQLMSQFLGESIMVTAIAIILSVVLIEISIPMFYAITGKALVIKPGLFALVILSLGLIVALITGIYPALYLSAVKPALVLKDKMIQTKGIGIRRAFIVFQFVTSMTLISASAIISLQLDFLQHKDLGFNSEEVLVLPLKDRSMGRRTEELRTELLKIKGVTGVSATSNIPGKSFNQNPIYAVRNPQDRIDASEAMIDPDFLKVMDINIVDGRSFLKNNPADSDGFILNETAVSQLGLKDPIGKEILWERDGPEVKGPVI
ncbi:MAG: ABC transporter permease [Bacteroidetes bacterium]|nr:ABC transporter permease [Bacteroidota bacterium]